MGSFNGHALPGSFFMIFGLWGFVNALKVYHFFKTKANRDAADFRSAISFQVPFCKLLNKLPVDPLIKIIATITGIFGEIAAADWSLVDKNGNFHNLGNHAHITMFAVFTIAALFEICQFFKFTTLPFGTEHLAYSVALFVEGLLFFFHLDGRPVLDKRLHILLYTVIFATSLVLLLEAWMKNSFLLLVARVYLFMLQGTWFFQIAHSLYGTHPWKDTTSNREIVPLIFTWHVASLFVFCLVCFILVSLSGKSHGCGHCCRRDLRCFRCENISLENVREDTEQDELIIQH